VKSLQNQNGFKVAFASGGFRATALFKLSKFGIDGAVFPSAFSDDSPIRSEIISCAIERSKPFTKISYVGDGVWDAKACRELEIPFIGRASGDKVSALEAEGAIGVIPDIVGATFIRLLQGSDSPSLRHPQNF
jgi:phosphoglycolate phosphatase-like HAD superfamily hydrolase